MENQSYMQWKRSWLPSIWFSSTPRYKAPYYKQAEHYFCWILGWVTQDLTWKNITAREEKACIRQILMQSRKKTKAQIEVESKFCGSKEVGLFVLLWGNLSRRQRREGIWDHWKDENRDEEKQREQWRQKRSASTYTQENALWACGDELYDTGWEQNRNAERREVGKGACSQKKVRDEGGAQEFIVLWAVGAARIFVCHVTWSDLCVRLD